MNDLITAYASGWQRSFDYGGRSGRGDYWWFVLANIIVAFILLILAIAIRPFSSLYTLYTIASIVPSIPLVVRRLRDAGKSWPWIFISLIPIVGGIWLIVLLCQPSLQGIA